jgi:hypothetical protein
MINEHYARGGSVRKLNVPRLQLHCTSDECSGLPHFRYSDGDRQVNNDRELQTFLTYLCSNCRKNKKIFSLFVAAGEKETLPGQCYKHGEMPPFGPITPPRPLKMLERNRDLFLKGRRCESQGLGIGAFVYYRRVVEDQRASIIGEIIRVAKLIKAPTATLEALEAARGETQFSRSLELIRDANAAYDVVPSQDWLRGWTVTCNGIPVRHFVNKAVAERYATDAEYRASLIVTKYADR